MVHECWQLSPVCLCLFAPVLARLPIQVHCKLALVIVLITGWHISVAPKGS
jgi:hypothetical protein